VTSIVLGYIDITVCTSRYPTTIEVYPNMTRDPGTWIIDPGTWIIDPETWIIDPGTWIIDLHMIGQGTQLYWNVWQCHVLFTY
jgi:hypothetical protein